MGLFDSKKDKEIEKLIKLNKNIVTEAERLRKSNAKQSKQLNELMSDGLRHGSKLASQYMRDKRKQTK